MRTLTHTRAHTHTHTCTHSHTHTRTCTHVHMFRRLGCGCTLYNGKPCSSQFTTEYITTYRNACLVLTHNELDLFLMGQLAAFGNSGQVVIESRHHEKEREKAYTTIYHRGRRVCMTMFRVLHAVGKKRIFNLNRSLKRDGVRPRVHGKASKLPKHTHLPVC